MYFNDTCTARAIVECEKSQETKQLMGANENFDH